MGIFDRFPYSSTHEMNLDFMLGKATEIAEDMQRVTAGMEQVQAGLTAISEKTEQATQAAAQAAQSASSIEGSVTAAEDAAEEAQMHNESAQTWANNALTYKADCQRAATEAAASSSSAAQAATAAAASEDTVAQYAQAANSSAQSAANNNDSAHQYANQASASASNATFHSSNAQTAATNAQTAATNAQTAATRTVALKDDCETLHTMCVAAVNQAATEAVNAANSAAQAAATKTDVETLVESLPEDFTDLNNTVNQLSDDVDDIKNGVYGYYPIAFTASPGARGGGNPYSESSFYHVDLPVVAGEKYHVKTATNHTGINAINVYKDGYTSMSVICAGTASGYVDEYVTIPDGYTIMTVNSSHRYGVIIEKYMGLKDAEESIYTSYFQNEIDDTVGKTRGFCEEKALVFAVVTDSHLNSAYGTQVWDDTAENMKRFNDEYQVDGIVHLGDMINGTDTKAISTSELDHIRNSLKGITGVKNASYLMGNHDTNTFYGSSMDDPITEAEMYSDMFRQNAIDIIRPDGKLYGYRDFDTYGVRVVYLCSSGGDGTHGGQGTNWKYPDDELTWVQNVALDTHYQVLFFSHMPMTEGTISTTSTLPTNGNALKTIVSNFIDNGGIVIGLIHGHTHYDYEYNNGKFYEVSIGCEDYTYTPTETHPTASYAPASAVIPARMRYTVTQDLWDVVIVRPVSRTVKLVRFGAGADRSFAY